MRRRSIREKWPNSDLITRRKILSKIPAPANSNRKLVTPKRRRSSRQYEIQIKKEPKINPSNAEELETNELIGTTSLESTENDIKQESIEQTDGTEPVGKSENFGE